MTVKYRIEVTSEELSAIVEAIQFAARAGQPIDPVLSDRAVGRWRYLVMGVCPDCLGKGQNYNHLASLDGTCSKPSYEEAKQKLFDLITDQADPEKINEAFGDLISYGASPSTPRGVRDARLSSDELTIVAAAIPGQSWFEAAFHVMTGDSLLHAPSTPATEPSLNETQGK